MPTNKKPTTGEKHSDPSKKSGGGDNFAQGHDKASDAGKKGPEQGRTGGRSK